MNQLLGHPGNAEPADAEVAQKQTVVTKTNGKKKIIPVMVQTFKRQNEKIDPSMNPFMGNQLL